ncbi:hypothetical protein LTR36_003456 [Oleoguttula mirabilis]|uniref:Osmotin, thaumatin-like protein n=1 Tax=Oleoguttula mirabilis TaxID=1507867 RepID=A0AAV9JIR0_9PEZI|nr:hypothetical protein LTR36_003456 [Oleoguttula mirabilis]
MACVALTGRCAGEHHMKRPIEPRQSSGSTPLMVANWCPETIWPAVLSQGGTGPQNTGFALTTGANITLSVSSDWQGRVWGRTNCSFSSNGQSSASGSGSACSTGDCGGVMACKSPNTPPATLAEITLDGGTNQDFYDISLVDGHNLDLAILWFPNGHSSLSSIDRSTTSPSCVASVGDLAAQNWDAYANGQTFLGTTSSDPLSFERNNSASTVSSWCPWDLQTQPPTKPGGGVYPYPDTDVARPAFDPCLSACAKYNSDSYCCTGDYDSSSKCTPSYYSKAAKSVCPDAYSYAFDDVDSTFITPTGGGYQIIFCPGGRSTNIIASKGSSAIEHSGSSGGMSRLQLDGYAARLAALAALVAVVMALL